MVRPEKLRIELAGEARRSPTGLPRVEGMVESSVYLGTATQIVVDVGEGVRMTVLVPNADESERQRLPGGGARVVLELGARAHARGDRRGWSRRRTADESEARAEVEA